MSSSMAAQGCEIQGVDAGAMLTVKQFAGQLGAVDAMLYGVHQPRQKLALNF